MCTNFARHEIFSKINPSFTPTPTRTEQQPPPLLLLLQPQDNCATEQMPTLSCQSAHARALQTPPARPPTTSNSYIHRGQPTQPQIQSRPHFHPIISWTQREAPPSDSAGWSLCGCARNCVRLDGGVGRKAENNKTAFSSNY